MTDANQNAIPQMTAKAVTRGVLRLFRQHGVFGLPEVALPNARRADIMAIGARGQITIVEIKCSKGDLLGDAKWPEYFDYCDRYYWAVPVGFELTLFDLEGLWPRRSGLIVADAYEASFVRDAPEEPLSAVRRKAMVQHLACLGARRLAQVNDPEYELDNPGY